MKTKYVRSEKGQIAIAIAIVRIAATESGGAQPHARLLVERRQVHHALLARTPDALVQKREQRAVDGRSPFGGGRFVARERRDQRFKLATLQQRSIRKIRVNMGQMEQSNRSKN